MIEFLFLLLLWKYRHSLFSFENEYELENYAGLDYEQPRHLRVVK